MALVCLVVICSGRTAAAQTTESEGQAGAFLGGSMLLASARSPQDPAGYGYLASYFHGSLPWAVGLMASGGVMVGEHVSVGAETAWQRSSTSVLEQSRGHFEFVDLHGRYARTELVMSVVSRAHFAARRGLSLEPVFGLSFARDRRSLTDRTGTYSYPPVGTIMTTRPDVRVSSVRMGVVAGGDGAFGRARANFLLGVRAYWVGGTDELRTLPGLGGVRVHLHAGVRWRGGLQAARSGVAGTRYQSKL